MYGPRLSPLDHSFLAYEAAHPGVNATIGLLVLGDGEAPELARLRARVTDRLSTIPALSRSLPDMSVHRRLTRPRWRSEPVDMANRVTGHIAHDGLEPTVDDLLSNGLDATAPWRLHLLKPAPGRGFAILYLAHHALHDGLSMAQLVPRLLADEPPTTALPSPKLPRFAALVGAASLGAGFAQTMPPSALHHREPGRHGEPGFVRGRRLVWAQLPLAELRAAARVPGATVNDVYLSTLADTVRAWTLDHDGSVPRRLVTLVPVSTRRPEQQFDLGNRVVAIRVAIDLAAESAYERLARVHRATSRARRLGQPVAAAALVAATRLGPAAATRVLGELTYHPRLTGLMASNVIGPAKPWTVLGTGVSAVVPINFLPAGHGLSTLLMSNAGDICVGFLGAADLPGLDELPDRWLRAIKELANS